MLVASTTFDISVLSFVQLSVPDAFLPYIFTEMCIVLSLNPHATVLRKRTLLHLPICWNPEDSIFQTGIRRPWILVMKLRTQQTIFCIPQPKFKKKIIITTRGQFHLRGYIPECFRVYMRVLQRSATFSVLAEGCSYFGESQNFVTPNLRLKLRFLYPGCR